MVTAVNGKSVEQPTTAFEVFESLRTVDELSVSLTRNGEARQLVFPIVGAPERQASPRQPETPKATPEPKATPSEKG